MIVEYFTFGIGHDFARHVQPIVANSPEEAREKMVQLHGNKWAFQYSEKEYLESRKKGFARETVLEPIILGNRKKTKEQQTIRRECNSCKELHQIEVYAEDLQAWENGKLIQEAMPYLPPDIRELMISGICGKCFDEMFATV